MKKIKLLSLFSGVGAFEKALERLGVEYDLVNYCEVDKYASKAYALIHNCSEEKNLGDITKVDARSLPHDIDLVTYGFPCQDISLAGKQKGFTDSEGNKTRSGLFFDALRIIDETKPKVAIAENVKNLVSKKFKNEFEIVLNSLDQAGYNSYYKVLNAKDYGIPQNRERVFIVSIRKDIDPFNIMFSFPFPEKEELKLRLKDMLEDEVDEKYYLSDKMTNFFYKNEKVQKEKGNGFRFGVSDGNVVAKAITTRAGGRMDDNFILIPEATKKGYAEAHEGDGVYLNRPHQKRGVVQKGMIQTLKTSGNDVGVVIGSTQKNAYVGTTDGISPTLTEAMGKGGGQVPMIADSKVTRLGGIFDKENEKHQAGSIYDKEGLSPTIDTGVGGWRQPLIASLWTETQAKMITPDGNVKRYIGSDVVDEFKEGQAADISFPNGYNKGPRVHDECPALNGTTTKNSFIVKSLRIRKLTPKECWRLMGFDDKDVDVLVNNGMSNTQLYKQAGNSIVVDVLVKIFSNLFKSDIIK